MFVIPIIIMYVPHFGKVKNSFKKCHREMVWCGVVWCGVVWCGVCEEMGMLVYTFAHAPTIITQTPSNCRERGRGE